MLIPKPVSVLMTCLFLVVPCAAQQDAFPVTAERVVFLGDSITHAGHFIALIEAQLKRDGHESKPELINLGLPSETCSGLSEPEHPFPRPNVHERIGRALERLQPDVVVACYGMNDGIYYPLNEERFAAYRKGIDEIIDKVHASGAKLVLMTPPAFDALPLMKKGKLLPAGADEYSWKAIYEHYDDVMAKYAAWVIQQADRVEMVIDLHTPVTDYVAAKRTKDVDFTMSPDGVHVNNEGHQVLASAILKAWGWKKPLANDPILLQLISARQQLMHHAWLSEVGHKRPGVKAGLPMAEANERSALIGEQIRARLAALDRE